VVDEEEEEGDEKKQSVKNVVNAGSGTEGFSQETTIVLQAGPNMKM